MMMERSRSLQRRRLQRRRRTRMKMRTRTRTRMRRPRRRRMRPPKMKTTRASSAAASRRRTSCCQGSTGRSWSGVRAWRLRSSALYRWAWILTRRGAAATPARSCRAERRRRRCTRRGAGRRPARRSRWRRRSRRQRRCGPPQARRPGSWRRSRASPAARAKRRFNCCATRTGTPRWLSTARSTCSAEGPWCGPAAMHVCNSGRLDESIKLRLVAVGMSL
mmetsp:Transcript_106451/g.311213  ORF Transcript_106451/g.311213 Transcript_106451/m.311213 type:complete len:220 (-) Transcript_106451:87-746(-)